MAGSIWQPLPLTNWVNIPAVLVAVATATHNSPFSSLAVAVTIASTHCAYPRRDGQAELASVAGYVIRQFTCPKAVTHPTTNRAQCRATALIETNALPLTLNRHRRLSKKQSTIDNWPRAHARTHARASDDLWSVVYALVLVFSLRRVSFVYPRRRDVTWHRAARRGDVVRLCCGSTVALMISRHRRAACLHQSQQLHCIRSLCDTAILSAGLL